MFTFLSKYASKCVVFWENLHSRQNFYMIDGSWSRDKFQLWLWPMFMGGVRRGGFYLVTEVDPFYLQSEIEFDW